MYVVYFQHTEFYIFFFFEDVIFNVCCRKQIVPAVFFHLFFFFPSHCILFLAMNSIPMQMSKADLKFCQKKFSFMIQFKTLSHLVGKIRYMIFILRQYQHYSLEEIWRGAFLVP